MKLTLDASHQTLLDNLSTFQRAQRCLQECQEYVWDILREVVGELPVSRDPAFRFGLSKGSCLQADAFTNWGDTGNMLIGIGIENLDVAQLVASEECWTYIYSHIFANSATSGKYPATLQFLRTLTPPDGYVIPPPDFDGYLFVRKLGNIPISTFCSRSDLKLHFKKPLEILAEWLTKVAPEIDAFSKTAAALPSAK